MNILLISTYELGRQPFGLASPAAWLRARGHHVSCLDLTRETLDEEAILAADLISFYVPMHTATRLAAGLVPKVRESESARSHLFLRALRSGERGILARPRRGHDSRRRVRGRSGEPRLALRARRGERQRLREAAGARDFSRAAEISCARPRGHAGAGEICARGDARRRASRCGLDRGDARVQASLPALPHRAGV